MVTIYVDADACPVKGEIERVADRHGLFTYWVADGGLRPPSNPNIKLVVVNQGADAADNWIAEAIAFADICVTNDIPLAARCLEKGALAIKPNGERFTENGIGMALAQRALMSDLRDQGLISGGPPSFGKKHRSAFLNAFETVVQAAKRASDARTS